MEPPATGPEAVDWSLRGLCELVAQALAVGDEALIWQVDRAAANIVEGSERFVDRLRLLRRHAGKVPSRYPTVRHEPPRTSWPSPATISAAVRCARHADRYRPAAPAQLGTAFSHSGADVATLVAAVAAQRPDPRAGHGCRSLPVDPELVWRAWFMGDQGPFLALPVQQLTPVAARMMFGLHVGVHLDHLAALHAEGRTAAAYRLQFGQGLLIAESVAMLVELLHLAGIPTEPTATTGHFLHNSIVDRIARLPGVQEWGTVAAPESATMAAAAEHPNTEFRTLPTLAAAYVDGPVRLAGNQCADEFLPTTLRRVLRDQARDARMARIVLPAEVSVG